MAVETPSRAAVSVAGEPASLARYGLAVVLASATILSQYVLPGAVPSLRPVYGSLLGGLGIVYGIPIVLFAILVGAAPLRSYASQMRRAAWEGVRWYGLLSVLGILITAVLIGVYSRLDPSALPLLNKTNPVVQAASGNPWFWVAFSFAIGGLEELTFRGWLFGFWRIRGGSSWLPHAIWTSALFAGLHLYYAQAYGPASPILYPTLFLLGFAFAATYWASGGNLVVVAFLHGLNDAAGFLTLISTNAALAIRLGTVLLGVVFALYQYFRGSPFVPHRPPPPRPWIPLPPG